jgi:trehalose synthase
MNANELAAVPIESLDPARLAAQVGSEPVARLDEAASRLRERLAGRRVVNINSTGHGGGVAEMLRTLLGYVQHLGIACDWLVIGGDPEFFSVTKRIHNRLYGGVGDGLDLDNLARSTYEGTLVRTVPRLRQAIRPDDVVVVHDPQPAGLVPTLLEIGVTVVWRCHVGLDRQNERSRDAWTFLRPYIEGAHAFVFSRSAFAPSWIPDDRLDVIPPSIDPFSLKNADLAPATVLALLAAAGIVSLDGHRPSTTATRPARIVRDGRTPDIHTPLVVQVSRWDRMKDMAGVLTAFTEGVPHSTGAHLVLAGPAVDAVDDDPEAREVWDESVALWQRLDPKEKARTHLVTVPMDDLDENARVVNAIQRHATLVVQKSLAEGFGLTVAEAMWKARPVVASAVGGIVDQIVDGESGLLHEPDDFDAFATHVSFLLRSPADCARLGANGRRRVAERFLADRHLIQYATMLERLVATRPS